MIDTGSKDRTKDVAAAASAPRCSTSPGWTASPPLATRACGMPRASGSSGSMPTTASTRRESGPATGTLLAGLRDENVAYIMKCLCVPVEGGPGNRRRSSTTSACSATVRTCALAIPGTRTDPARHPPDRRVGPLVGGRDPPYRLPGPGPAPPQAGARPAHLEAGGRRAARRPVLPSSISGGWPPGAGPARRGHSATAPVA